MIFPTRSGTFHLDFESSQKTRLVVGSTRDVKLNLRLGALAVANLFVSLLSQWYVITRLGVGASTDALFAGMAVPQLALAILSSSLTHVLVPILSGEDDLILRESVWAFFLGVSALFSCIAIVLYVAAPAWVPWLVPGFRPNARALTVLLTRIQLPGVVFTASSSVLWSAFYARNRFIWAEISPVIAGLAAFAILVPGLPRFGVSAAAWANTARPAMQLLLLLPVLGRWRRAPIGSPTLTAAWSRLRPLLVGTTYYKLDPLVDRVLSSMAPAGGLSALYLGQQIWGAASQIVNKGVAAPLSPLLALQAKSGEWHAFGHTVRQRLVWTFVLTMPVFVGFLVAGRPILRLLIGHGGVTADNVSLLWRIMVALGGVLVAGSAGFVSSRAFYSFGDTRTPTRIGVVSFSIYVPIKVLSFLLFGLTGIALTTSLFVVFNLVAQLFFLGRFLRARGVAYT